MGLVEVLWADVEGRELGEGGGGAKATLFDVFDFVVGDEVLGYTAYGEGEGLTGGA